MIVNENGRMPEAEKAFHHYETILYAFYNKEITIDDLDMAVALLDCYQLLEISDYLGCTSLVSKPIEVALFKHGQNAGKAGACHERIVACLMCKGCQVLALHSNSSLGYCLCCLLT